MPEEPKPDAAQAALLEQYELPDSSFDPALDNTPSTPPAVTADNSPPVASPTNRNPDGTFKSVKETTDTKPAHSSRIVRMATDLGVTDAEMASMTPAELREEVRELREHASYLAEQNRRTSHDPLFGPPTTGAPAAPASPAPTGKPAYLEGIEDIDKVADPILEVFKRMQARIEQLESQNNQAAARETYTNIDMGFADLGKSYETLFGTGRGEDMRRGDRSLDRRLAVVNSVRNDPPKGLSVRAAIKQRAQEMFGSLTPAQDPEPDPANGRISPEQWRQGGLATPATRRAPPEPKGERRAMKTIAAKMQERGINEDDYGTEEAGIPD